MNEQQFDLEGNPVGPAVKQTREPADAGYMPPDKDPDLTGDTPEWWSAFFAMLDDVGITVSRFDHEQLAHVLKQVPDDYPVAWIQSLQKTVVAQGVMNAGKAAEWLLVSHKRQIEPGTRPADTPTEEPDRHAVTDDAWHQHLTTQEAQKRVALERAIRHIAEVDENQEDRTLTFRECSPASHAMYGCPIVDYGIFNNEFADEGRKEFAREKVKRDYERPATGVVRRSGEAGQRTPGEIPATEPENGN